MQWCEPRSQNPNANEYEINSYGRQGAVAELFRYHNNIVVAWRISFANTFGQSVMQIVN